MFEDCRGCVFSGKVVSGYPLLRVMGKGQPQMVAVCFRASVSQGALRGSGGDVESRSEEHGV